MRESTFTNAICKAESKQISKDFAYCEDALGRAENAIGNLPSAQPEKRTEERTETHACDLIDREAAVDAIYHHLPSVSRTRARTMLHEVPSAQPEIKPIDYQDCANAMLRMWMDGVVTDGEYNRIMDKLNAFWRTRNERSD